MKLDEYFIKERTGHLTKINQIWIFFVIVHCQLQVAVLTSEFYSNLTHFCDKVNIFNIVVSNGNIIQTLSQTSSYDRKKITIRTWYILHIFSGIQTPIDKHTFHIKIASRLTWKFGILSYKTHCAWFLRWIYTAIDPQQMTCDNNMCPTVTWCCLTSREYMIFINSHAIDNNMIYVLKLYFVILIIKNKT
jgi:hypothetical protein